MKLLVIGSAVLAVACSSAGDSGRGGGTTPSEKAAPAGPTLPRVTDRDSANASLGKQVRVEGTALNAKLGPVVSTGGLVIYCFGKQEWSTDEVGQQVAVTGTLEQTDEFKAEVSEDGLHSAGTGGRDLVIRDCRVEGR